MTGSVKCNLCCKAQDLPPWLKRNPETQTPSMRMYNYRCKKRINGKLCDARESLKRKVEDYIRKPTCKSCGKTLSYHDKAVKRRNKREKCYCAGASFTPHKSGTKGCEDENKNKANISELNESLNVGITIVNSDEPPF